MITTELLATTDSGIPLNIGVHQKGTGDGIFDRLMTIKLILDNGDYKESSNPGSNVLQLQCDNGYSNCNAHAGITKSGLGLSSESASVTIHGLDKTTIEQLTYMQTISPEDLGINAIEIYAGNRITSEDSLPNMIYRGQIFSASLPTNPASNDIGFSITSLSGGNSLSQYTQTTSVDGRATVESVVRNIIAKAEYGYTPDINIPVIYVSDVYLKGNWRVQLQKICTKFRLKFKVDADIIRVAEYNKPFPNIKKTVISAKNILQGSPAGADRFVIAETWFDSDLIYGQKIQLDSQFDYFNGDYIITGMRMNIANNDDAWDNQLSLMRYYGG